MCDTNIAVQVGEQSKTPRENKWDFVKVINCWFWFYDDCAWRWLYTRRLRWRRKSGWGLHATASRWRLSVVRSLQLLLSDGSFLVVFSHWQGTLVGVVKWSYEAPQGKRDKWGQQAEQDTAGQLMTVALRRPSGHWRRLWACRTPVPLPPMVASLGRTIGRRPTRPLSRNGSSKHVSITLTLVQTSDNLGLIVSFAKSKILCKNSQTKVDSKSVSSYRFREVEVPTATTLVRYRTRSKNTSLSANCTANNEKENNETSFSCCTTMKKHFCTCFIVTN